MDKTKFSEIIEVYDNWDKKTDEDENISYVYNEEHVDLEISSIQIERPKRPQARLQCQTNIEICKREQSSKSRFFLFGVSNPSKPEPDAPKDKKELYNKYKDIVVSIEGVSNTAPGRFDIVDRLNEAIKYFEQHKNETFIRLSSKNDYYQSLAVFKPIYDKGGDISYPALEYYLKFFDNRPYRSVIYNTARYVRVNGMDANNNTTTSFYKNWLISGAPGTGKSYMLDQKVFELITGNKREDCISELIKEDQTDDSEELKRIKASNQLESEISKYVRRVTFFEDYSYENFVGCYKPLPVEDDITTIELGSYSGKLSGKKITYEYSAGPFIDVLCDATLDENHAYILIIEEINRARAASVFGDMFLALDRDKNGSSVYYVTPVPELDDYLQKRLGNVYDGKLRIPPNMYIWATMNSADQGVFYMDSAFKRRWNYTIRNVFEARQGNDAVVTISLFYKDGIHDVLWDDFRALINKRIAEIAEEDSFIGPWYLTNNELNEIKEFLEKRQKGDFSSCPNPLVDKLFLYLRQDIFRNDPTMIFKGSKETISISSILNIYNSENQIPNIDSILDFDEKEWEDLFSNENVANNTHDVDDEKATEDEADSSKKPKN